MSSGGKPPPPSPDTGTLPARRQRKLSRGGVGVLPDKEVGRRLNGARCIFVKYLEEGEGDQPVPRKLTKKLSLCGSFPGRKSVACKNKA